MLEDVRQGLAREQKELPPTWFYDALGSRLFERITTLPEYYLTRAEREILVDRVGWIAEQLPAATLAELGAGSAGKTQLLLEALREVGGGVLYVPVDVARDVMASAAVRLSRSLPGLSVRPVERDMRDDVSLPPALPGPVLYAFLGSTIGNFERDDAVRLLSRMRGTLSSGDGILLGTDLVKRPATLLAAYDDAQGVTAAFNLNVLRVLNRELGADFDIDAFAHRVVWNEERRRIEMHLVARQALAVHIPRVGTIPFLRGESIRTEVSCKYDRPAVETMLGQAGFDLRSWLTDASERFALSLAVAT